MPQIGKLPTTCASRSGRRYRERAGQGRGERERQPAHGFGVPSVHELPSAELDIFLAGLARRTV